MVRNLASPDSESAPTEPSPTSSHCYQLECCVMVQPISVVGQSVPKKVTYRNSLVTLGRNEHRQILIRFGMGKIGCATYLIQQCKVHHKLARQEGKVRLYAALWYFG